MESSTSLFIFLVIFIANDKNREKVLVSSYSYQFADVNTYLLYVLSICVLRSENSIGFPAFQIKLFKKNKPLEMQPSYLLSSVLIQTKEVLVLKEYCCKYYQLLAQY